MAYSNVNYIGNGSTDSYSIPFSYISKADIDVYLNGVLTTNYTYTNDYTIKFNSIPASGVAIRIERNTTLSSRLVDYQDGSTLTEEVLDLDSKQAFYLIQESIDGTKETLNLDTDLNWDGQSKRLKNISNPINSNDVVTLGYLEGFVPNIGNDAVNFLKETFTATAGQTLFTFTYPYIQNSNTLQVFINGVKLNNTQYTETTDHSVTLTTGANLNDKVEFLYVQKIPVLDTEVIKYNDYRNLKEKLSDFVSVKDYGALGDGVADDTIAIQLAINTGKTVYFPIGIYNISSTLWLMKNGQRLVGDSKLDTQIRNLTNSQPLLKIGNPANSLTHFGQYCSVSNMYFVGNATTTAGIEILSILEDGTPRAARDVTLDNIQIQYIGAGYALRISSWECQTSSVTIWDCYKGIRLGSECNSLTAIGTYISRCTNEAVELLQGDGMPSNINFFGLSAQYSGGVNGTINLEDGFAIQFNGLYLEGNNAPNNVYLTNQVKNVTINNGMHNKVAGLCERIIYSNNIKGVTVNGFVNVGGAVESIIKITGTLPYTYCSNLYDATPSLTIGLVDDQSTRKTTIFNDPLQGLYGMSKFKSLTSQNNIELVDSATNTVKMSFKNGRIVFGDGEVAQFGRAGSTIEAYSGSGTTLANLRAQSMLFGTASTKIISGIGDPNGAYTADVGSLFLRTNGGAGSTLYVKESGTGNTGWVAK